MPSHLNGNKATDDELLVNFDRKRHHVSFCTPSPHGICYYYTRRSKPSLRDDDRKMMSYIFSRSRQRHIIRI